MPQLCENKYRNGVLDLECAIQTGAFHTITNNNLPYVVSKYTWEIFRLFELVSELFDKEIEGREFNVKVV